MTDRIRPIAVCVFLRDGSILVAEGTDPETGETFLRPPGGEIEFGELGEEALRREILEETGEEIREVRLLGVMENRFRYGGRDCHELVFVYDGHFVSERMGRGEVYVIRNPEEGWRNPAWIQLPELRRGRRPVYPDGLLDLPALQSSPGSG